MSHPAIDEEDAQPRFLLAGPARVDAVAAVLASLRPAGFLLRPGEASVQRSGDLSELRKAARTSGVAFFVEDDVDLALEIGADGVHLSSSALVRTTRDKLRDHQILGASAGLSRHEAMTSGELGADYISFGDEGWPLTDEIVDLVAWWRETTVLPCLAYAADAGAVEQLGRIGTDFIGVASAIWDHPKGPTVAAGELAAAIEKS